MYAQFFVLFAIMLTGYLFRKKGILEPGMDNSLNRFIVYFAYPCMIVVNIGSLDMTPHLIASFFLMTAIGTAGFFIFFLFSRLFTKARHIPPQKANVAEFAMVSPNNGFMGFPIALIFFGEEALFLMLASNAAMNIFFFTYGIALMQRNREKEPFRAKALWEAFRKLVFNPNILALIIGLVICLMHWHIPVALNQYLTYMGNVSTPMALIYIGASLTTSNFFSIVKNRLIVECSINKLFVMPLISFVLLYFLPLNPMIIAMTVLANCFPTATTVSMLAQQEGQDTVLASQILFLNTVFSVVSIPLVIQFINLVIL